MQSDDQQLSDARKPFARVASNGFVHSSTSPRLVTRGETHEPDENAPSAIAIVDWLAFTVKPPPGQDIVWLMDVLETTFKVPRGNWYQTGRGWNGYTHRVDLLDFGLVAFGGDAQKGSIHVELNAHACRFIEDWNATRVWGETYCASITRIDLAHDDFKAEQVSVQSALQWLRDGKFNSTGRPPAAQLIDDLGSNKGKTLYVGQRTSGKLLRIYEKGKQLGDAANVWVRAEVELRNKSRIVPWGVVMAPGKYLAGAYPALRFLSAAQNRLCTTRRASQISYETMVKNLRTQGESHSML